MAHIEINIPETLQYQLESLSQNEGISLNQYIVYALTRQVALTPLIHEVPEKDVICQHNDFTERIKRLGKASDDDLEKIMEDREPAVPEPALNSEVISRLKNRISEAKNGNP
ncbi:MAG: toxin-antitoxin system HicB family antitoxin [Desulfobacteraceae bacterium]|nr:toxin-antitoxin system HicB family antitoxin [Desulfobacteraceae bacterium]